MANLRIDNLSPSVPSMLSPRYLGSSLQVGKKMIQWGPDTLYLFPEPTNRIEGFLPQGVGGILKYPTDSQASWCLAAGFPRHTKFVSISISIHSLYQDCLSHSSPPKRSIERSLSIGMPLYTEGPALFGLTYLSVEDGRIKRTHACFTFTKTATLKICLFLIKLLL